MKHETVSRFAPAHETRTRRTFTLIELLIVVAIIGILAAMLLPALQSARKSALAAGCTNNAKQLGTLAMMYSNDTQYYMPVTGANTFDYYYGKSTPSCDSLWDRVLIQYLPGMNDVVEKLHYNGTPDSSLLSKGSVFQSIKIFACPADNIPRANSVRDKYPLRSFGMSHAAGNDGRTLAWNGTAFKATRRTMVPVPTRTILLTEWAPFTRADLGFVTATYSAMSAACTQMLGIYGKWGEDYSGKNFRVVEENIPKAERMNPRSLHNHSWNYLFCDGHVAMMYPGATIRTGEDPVSSVPCHNMWTIDPTDDY